MAPGLDRYRTRAVNWAINNAGSLALSNPIPVLENGEVRGRWFFTGLSSQMRNDREIDLTFSGICWASHDTGKNMTFSAVVTVTYRVSMIPEKGLVKAEFVPTAIRAIDSGDLRSSGFVGSLGVSLIPGYVQQKIRDRIAPKLSSGFTVQVPLKTMGEFRFAMGVGAEADRKLDAPKKDLASSWRGRVILWEDGRDYIGPIKLKSGQEVIAKGASTGHWGMDAYLVDADLSKRDRESFIYNNSCYDLATAAYAQNRGENQWQLRWKASSDCECWIVLDNANWGRAKPPENMRNDKIEISLEYEVR